MNSRNTAGSFFLHWLRNPREIGAISPSSTTLARAMAAQVGDVGEGTVIELGAGTGVITEALVEAGVPPAQLLIVEKNPRMAAVLALRFPAARVLREDATRLACIAREHAVADARIIVSALPLLLLERDQQQAVFEQAFRVLAAGGVFLQFTYGMSKPVPERVLARLGLVASRAALVWRNVPPATVWRFEAPARASAPCTGNAPPASEPAERELRASR